MKVQIIFPGSGLFSCSAAAATETDVVSETTDAVTTAVGLSSSFCSSAETEAVMDAVSETTVVDVDAKWHFLTSSGGRNRSWFRPLTMLRTTSSLFFPLLFSQIFFLSAGHPALSRS